MKSLWDSRQINGKSRLDQLVYRSHLMGQSPSLCVWGGGNTSTKIEEKDFLGRVRWVLRVKGSGSDLKSCQPHDFSPLLIEDILLALERDQMSDEEMVEYLTHCLLDPKAPRPSIEALLHAFVPENDVDHTHADAILSLTNTSRPRQICQEVFGNELLWIEYVRPGFQLAKQVAVAYRRDPKTKGAVLEKHGLITWGTDARTSYERTIEMVTRAEEYVKRHGRKMEKIGARPLFFSPARKREFLRQSLPIIRRTLSKNKRVILTCNDAPSVLDYVSSSWGPKAANQGPATPDHMLRTKRIPLFVNGGAPTQSDRFSELLIRQIERYARDHKEYYRRYNGVGSRPNLEMLDPYPRVILIPGIGMITSGKDLKEARIVSEIYEHSIQIQQNACRVDTYRSLPPAVAFDVEYWPLELYKLTLSPSEAELSCQIGLITGAAGGIGRGIAWKLAQGGAHLVLTDLNKEKVKVLSEEINQKLKSPRTIGIEMDVTDQSAVQHTLDQTVLFFGGLDFLVSNAGTPHVGAIDELPLEEWDQSLSVNATGHFLVAREAIRILKAQGMGGTMVFIASKNVLAPGKEFGAYSAAKAAQTQLARILAIEGGEFGIRVNIINPDGVFEGSGLWEKIKQQRAKTHGISPEELEQHYQDRNLLKARVFPEDVASAALFLVSNRSAKTTGCILTVDGGVREAFPR